MKYTATIVEDQGSLVHVRISGEGKLNDGPQTGGQVRLVAVLHGDNEEKLKRVAIKIAGGWDMSAWKDNDNPGFHTAWIYVTKDKKQIKVRYTDKPDDDESHVLDTMNDANPKRLKLRVRRYLLVLKKNYGIKTGPNLP